MNTTGFGQRRGATGAGVAIAILVLIALATGLIMASKRGESRPPAPSSPGLQITVGVEPFEVGNQVQASWYPSLFADSLAEQLSRVRGIHAVRNSSEAQFVLRGSVSMNEGRLIVATRLARGARDTVWTATFWRSSTAGSSVLSDIASAVAEAVLVASVGETLTPKRKNR